MSLYYSEKISDLLKKYIRLVPKDILIKEFFIKQVNKKISVSLDNNQVSISNKTIRLKTNSVVKNVIFLQKEYFLTIIKKEFGENVILDII